MAIPLTLKPIDEKKAMSIIKKHKEGYWEYQPFNSDFIFEGRMTKYGYRRMEMIRADNICGRKTFEYGVVSN